MLLKALLAISFSFANTQTTASDFLSWQDFEKESSPKSLVFISSECPCSKSHIKHIKSVISKNPKMKVFAVSTESMEDQEVKDYYKNLGLTVIKDKESVLLNKYKALKTPHVTVIESGKIVYQGGVTNKKDPKSATKFYFRDVLKALSSNTPPPYKNGRSLGCYIPRSKK